MSCSVMITIGVVGSHPPKANRMDKLGYVLLWSIDHVTYCEAMSLESLHSPSCDLVLRLTGQHQRYQHLEAAYLCMYDGI